MSDSQDANSATGDRPEYVPEYVHDELLTVQEAAQRLGVGDTAVRNAILRGRLPHVRRYGRKLIRATDLDAYQATAKVGRPVKAPAANTDATPEAQALATHE